MEDTNIALYGFCDRCGGTLIPVWFIEEETKIEEISAAFS